MPKMCLLSLPTVFIPYCLIHPSRLVPPGSVRLLQYLAKQNISLFLLAYKGFLFNILPIMVNCYHICYIAKYIGVTSPVVEVSYGRVAFDDYVGPSFLSKRQISAPFMVHTLSTLTELNAATFSAMAT